LFLYNSLIMHIDNQKISDQSRFNPNQHSKTESSPYGGSSGDSPQFESHLLDSE
jgi:hypothetical protein